jgi:hypothetical protein
MVEDSRTRWLTAGAVCAALVLLTLLVRPAGAGADSITCSLGGCGPPTVSAPTVVISAPTPATDAAPDSATFQATIDPHGSETAYGFQYSSDGDPADPSSGGVQPRQTLPGSDQSQSVSWTATGLSPNTHYEVELVASGGQDEAMTVVGGPVSFMTPLEPATPVSLKLRYTSIAVGSDPVISAEIGAEYSPATGIDVQAAATAAGPFTTVAAGEPVTAHTRPYVSGSNLQWTGGMALQDAKVFAHNVYLRLESSGTGAFGSTGQTRQVGYSAPLFLPVYASALLEIAVAGDEQPGGHVVPPDRVSATVGMGAGVGSDPPDVYVYRRRPGGHYSRILELRYSRRRKVWLEDLHATRFDPGGTFLVCTVRPVASDLGVPFTFTACGAPQVTGLRGPTGSEYLTTNHEYTGSAVAPVGIHGS